MIIHIEAIVVPSRARYTHAWHTQPRSFRARRATRGIFLQPLCVNNSAALGHKTWYTELADLYIVSAIVASCAPRTPTSAASTTTLDLTLLLRPDLLTFRSRAPKQNIAPGESPGEQSLRGSRGNIFFTLFTILTDFRSPEPALRYFSTEIFHSR